MTQRNILAGSMPTVIIKAGGSVNVKGHDSEMVTVESLDKWGLSVEKRSEAEIARARAAVGEHVLFDIRVKKPDFRKTDQPEDVIVVQLSGSGDVWVPMASTIKVYAGKNIDIQTFQGKVDAYAGANLNLENVYCLGNASAGRAMNLDCQTMPGNKVEFKAGNDLRFHVRDLISCHVQVRDIGGYWEAKIGTGEKSVSLKCGGDVTLITDQKVEPLPPHYILGRIEKPQ
ncbi:MAG: hypothetical protein CVU39_07105 [Chloroflexi bacterium HGW-Chloroflexi-10]|nr:MAG: hypothetical protein CVU39_07105 [Chloroflexi bacterium HGW-Chloroflexi-10]